MHIFFTNNEFSASLVTDRLEPVDINLPTIDLTVAAPVTLIN